MTLILEILFIVLLLLWFLGSVPNSPLGPRAPVVNNWVPFFLFVILGVVVFGGQYIR